MIKKIVLIMLLSILICMAVIGARIAQLIYKPVSITHTLCEIRSGDTGRTIANTLYEHNVIRNRALFHLLIRLKDLDRDLKAGHYLFTGELNMFEVLEKIVSGEILVERITIPEGFSIYRTFRTITNRGIGDYNRFLELANNSEFASSITGFNIVSIEGFLYPDTYIFGHDMSEEAILRTMVRNFFNRMNIAHICLEDHEQFYRDLVLASIVEREAIFNDEMPLIAGVFQNRLRRGMRLQADPTVVYHLEREFIHRRIVTYADLRVNTPHNTYIIPGLPPYPICSPSSAAIFAVLNPDPSEYLFFFARRGRHIFTKTFQEHMRLQRETRVVDN